MEDNTTYLHPTGINQYLECGANYYFAHVERVKTNNKYHLAFGTSIHRALAENYSQKILSKVDLPIESVMDKFADIFDNEFQSVDKRDLVDIKEGQLKDSGIKLIEKYQTVIAPRVFPTMVEKTIKIKFPNYDYGLQGTLDLADIYDVITDHKTTSKEIKENTVGYQRQVGGFYPILFEAYTKKPAKSAHIHYMRRDNETIFVRNVPIDKQYALSTLQTVGNAMKSDVFIPNRNSFLCRKRFCRFAEICMKKHGGIVKE